jgi:thiazole synthase
VCYSNATWISYWIWSRFKNLENIQIIIENSNVPVIVDAGIGTPSEAAQAMEVGADGVLLNTAVAQAKDPAQMALAMKLGVEAGRLAYLAGRMDKKIMHEQVHH